MALRMSKPSEIPKGAVVVDENEAIIYQWQNIRSWPSIRDVWPFRLGLPLLGLAGTIGALTVNTHFRRKLKVLAYGQVATTFAVGLTPALVIAGTHAIAVTQEILLNKNECLLCLQQRAIALQVGVGVCWPMTLAPLANMMLATRHGTYRLPHWSDWRGTLGLWWRFIKAGQSKFITLAVFEALAAGYIVYKEKESFLHVQMKMMKLDSQLETEAGDYDRPINVGLSPFEFPKPA